MLTQREALRESLKSTESPCVLRVLLESGVENDLIRDKAGRGHMHVAEQNYS